MKDQYFGDINDYRKYGLLRVLARASDLRVGICWMLTPQDGGGDGELRTYLDRPAKWRQYDPELYEALSRLLQGDVERSVRCAPEWNLVPGARYFEPLLLDGASDRAGYFSSAWEQLAGCELLFLDPDNGIEVPSTACGRRGSSKYVYWRDLKDGFSRGHSLLIYQHYPRVPREQFVPFLAGRLGQELGCARVTAFRTSHVAFFLAQQPAHHDALEGVGAAVHKQWRRQIQPWPESEVSRGAG